VVVRFMVCLTQFVRAQQTIGRRSGGVAVFAPVEPACRRFTSIPVLSIRLEAGNLVPLSLSFLLTSMVSVAV